MSKIQVILVDDQQLFRVGIKTLIEKQGFAEVIGEASDGLEFLNIIKDLSPDLILMDIEMPNLNGIEAIRQAILMKPELNFLVLSMYADEFHYSKMIYLGAKGFLLKSSNISELEKAITEVAAGHFYFSNEILKNIVGDIKQIKEQKCAINFNDREIEVLNLICSGLTNEEIAEKIHLSISSVENLKATLLDKTNAQNTANLIIFAIKHQLVDI